MAYSVLYHLASTFSPDSNSYILSLSNSGPATFASSFFLKYNKHILSSEPCPDVLSAGNVLPLVICMCTNYLLLHKKSPNLVSQNFVELLFLTGYLDPKFKGILNEKFCLHISWDAVRWCLGMETLHVFIGPGRVISKVAAHMYGKLVLTIGGKPHLVSLIASSWAGWVSSWHDSCLSLKSDRRNQDRNYSVFYKLASEVTHCLLYGIKFFQCHRHHEAFLDLSVMTCSLTAMLAPYAPSLFNRFQSQSSI